MSMYVAQQNLLTSHTAIAPTSENHLKYKQYQLHVMLEENISKVIAAVQSYCLKFC